MRRVVSVGCTESFGLPWTSRIIWSAFATDTRSATCSNNSRSAFEISPSTIEADTSVLKRLISCDIWFALNSRTIARVFCLLFFILRQRKTTSRQEESEPYEHCRERLLARALSRVCFEDDNEVFRAVRFNNAECVTTQRPGGESPRNTETDETTWTEHGIRP